MADLHFLRELFAPDLSVDKWPPVLSRPSKQNIVIGSTWSYDRNIIYEKY